MGTTTELTKEYIETRIGSMISDKTFDVLKGRYEDLNLSVEVFGDYCYMLNKRFKFLFKGQTISEMIDKIF